MNRSLAAPTHMMARLLSLVLLSSVIGHTAPQKFSSGPAQVNLIELFTSEGCSSCPPAEAWLRNLRHDPGLWRNFVPVAFHVNYWDRLGWPDRFARRQFTDRQYHYGSVWGVSTVYTPGFVLNGRDWGGHTDRRPPVSAGNAGTLAVEIAAGRCVVTYTTAADTRDGYEVSVALLGGGIVSKVRAGENRGETLQHEFVALALVKHALAKGRGEFALPSSATSGVGRRALAVWVTRRDASEPLQAAGGWLD
jgi:hypothetical protein